MFVETRPLPLLLIAVGGLFSGALANVAIYRDAARVSLWRGRFACPDCDAPAPFYHRVPLVSYVLSRGRRRGCGDRIRLQDPVVELACAVGWVLVAARLGVVPVLPAFLALTTTLVALSAVDLKERRIPNKMLGPMAVVAALLLVAAAAAEGEPLLIGRMAVGGLGYAVPLFVLGVVAPGSMGMGDVKLAAYLGAHLAWLSLGHVLVGAFMGFLLGAALGLGLMAVRKMGRKDTLPFGPSMCLGAFLVLFVGSVPGLLSP